MENYVELKENQTKVFVNLKIDPFLKKQLVKEGKDQEMTLTAYITDILEKRIVFKP